VIKAQTFSISHNINMYQKLIVEEFWELQNAIKADDKVEQLDALVDILVVTIGAIHSMGSRR